jgi:dipeptidase E
MRFYLSSYGVGSDVERLKGLIPRDNAKFGYIPNALDFTGADPERRRKQGLNTMDALRQVGMDPELLDLKDYFGKNSELEAKMSELGGVWISGGNTFVLRQAMRLSGLDEVLKGSSLRADFLYGGFSAAGCVLAPNLHAYQVVDNPNDFPYSEVIETIWEGLGLVDFAFMPHFDSDHSESADIDREIQYCKEHHIPFKAVRDGEVIIIGMDTGL